MEDTPKDVEGLRQALADARAEAAAAGAIASGAEALRSRRSSSRS